MSISSKITPTTFSRTSASLKPPLASPLEEREFSIFSTASTTSPYRSSCSSLESTPTPTNHPSDSEEELSENSTSSKIITPLFFDRLSISTQDRELSDTPTNRENFTPPLLEPLDLSSQDNLNSAQTTIRNTFSYGALKDMPVEWIDFLVDKFDDQENIEILKIITQNYILEKIKEENIDIKIFFEIPRSILNLMNTPAFQRYVKENFIPSLKEILELKAEHLEIVRPFIIF